MQWEVFKEIRTRFDPMSGEPSETSTIWIKDPSKESVYEDTIAIVHDNNEKHASLLAAAPEMLEILKDLEIEITRLNLRPTFPSSYCVLVNVIMKAEGLI